MANDIERAQRIVEAAWKEVLAHSFYAHDMGDRLDRLPQISPEAVCRHARVGRDLLSQIAGIALEELPDRLAMTLELVRWRAEIWSREEEWYWLVFATPGWGFFAMFAPTAYSGGHMLGEVEKIFLSATFDEPGDEDRYLGLLADYARLVRQMHARTLGQYERGILLPRDQIDDALHLLTGLNTRFVAAVGGYVAGLDGVSVDFTARVQARLSGEVARAYRGFVDFLDGDAYRAAARSEVGLGQYAGGAEIYEALIGINVTLPMTARDLHERGLARGADIWGEMQALLAEVGFDGDPGHYFDHIAADPTWRLPTSALIEARFQDYIDRIAPHIDTYFSFRPEQGHRARPLPEALQGAMTFGYYNPPKPGQDEGIYFFNPRHLATKPLVNVGSTTYHELVPGHHFHFATQMANSALPPIQQYEFINGFNEAWAEYAATFAGEIGMYRTPEERFGRLMNESFLTARLVVDTGLNVLGWSLDQARRYMQRFSFKTDFEIDSELKRYATGIPAQSLAYKTGDKFLASLREEMRARLGNGFDLRVFHKAVLENGALPLPLIARWVGRAMTDPR